MAMNRRRTLITSPLDWFLTANPVSPPAMPVLAEREGTQLKTPRPVVLARAGRIACRVLRLDGAQLVHY
jgi:hypothetical protein